MVLRATAERDAAMEKAKATENLYRAMEFRERQTAKRRRREGGGSTARSQSAMVAKRRNAKRSCAFSTRFERTPWRSWSASTGASTRNAFGTPRGSGDSLFTKIVVS